MADLNPIRGSFRFDTSNLDRAFAHAEARTRSFEGTASSAFTRVASSAQKVVRVVALVGAALAATAITAGAVGIIKVGTAYEQLRVQLETVTGSANAATAAFQQILKFAVETPFEVEELTRAFIGLKARGFDPTRENLLAIGNLAAAFGKGFNDAMQAVTQAAFGEAEMLKQFGIIMRQEGAKASITFKGITQTVQKTPEAIFAALMEISKLNFAGAMKRQTDTVKGAWSNLQDALSQALDKGFRAGAGEGLKNFLREVTSLIEQVTPAFQVLGFVMGKAFQVAGEVVKDVSAAIGLASKNWDTFSTAAIATASTIALITAPITTVILAIVAAILLAVDSIKDWGAAFQVIPAAVDVMNAAVAKGTAWVTMQVVKVVQVAVNGIISAINWAIKGISGFAKSISGFAAAMALIDPKARGAAEALRSLANLKPLEKKNFVSDLKSYVAGLDVDLQASKHRLDEFYEKAVDPSKQGAITKAWRKLKKEFQDATKEAIVSDTTSPSTRKKTTPPDTKGGKAHKKSIDDVTKALIDQITKLRERRIELGLTDRQLEEYKTVQDAASVIGRKLKNVTVEQRQALAEVKTAQELANFVVTQKLGLKDEEIRKILILIGLLEKERQAVQKSADAKKKLEEIRNVAREVGSSLERAFSDAIVEGRSLSDVLKQLEKDLLRLFIRKAIFEPLFGGGATGGGGLFGNLLSTIFTKSAHGNVFKYARGGVTGPDVFPMARGVGVVGDNPTHQEAIMPLVRSSSGDLGVRTVVSGGGGSNVVVNVYAPEGSSVSQSRQKSGDREQIDLYIDQAVARRMQPGGATYKQIRNVFGLSQQTVTR